MKLINYTLPLLLLLTQVAQALPDDSQKPVEINAAEAIRDEKAGTMIYTGDVVVVQGSIVIRADKVEVRMRDGEVQTVVATGSPAHYQQKPSVDKGTIMAQGNQITYDMAKSQMHLRQDARLEQDGGIITGSQIDYDVKGERMVASGRAGASSKGGSKSNGRVTMVIPPSKNRKLTNNKTPAGE